MAKRLHKFTNRDKSHARLAEILKADPTSTAECREDANAGEFYIYDGPQPPPTPDPNEAAFLRVQAARVASADAEQLDALAELIATKVAAKLKVE